jgi:hypothetical protein
MNLLQIQDALKNASDQQLVQLVQSPDSTAPSYLVLSELKRRKEMRAQQQQEPQGTVAEDLAKDNTYDDQGIRALKTPGYEAEEQEAEQDGAGIEAMREGGVVRMSDGGRPRRLEDFYTGRPLTEMSDEELYSLANSSPSESRRLNLGTLGISQPSGFFRNQEENDIISREARLLLARRMPASARLPLPEGMDGSAGQFNQSETAPPSPSNPPVNQTPPAAPPSSLISPQAGDVTPPAEAAGAPGSSNAPAGGGTRPAGGGNVPAAAGAGGIGGAGGGAGGAGVGGGGLGIRELMERNASLFPDTTADIRKQLSEMRTDPKARRDEALNMALMEAGLRIAASNNPRLAGAIGEGATPALQAYSQQTAQIRQDQRADIKDQLALAQADLQRQFANGQISGAELRARTQLLVAQMQERGANARAGASLAGRQVHLSPAEIEALTPQQREYYFQSLGYNRSDTGTSLASIRPRIIDLDKQITELTGELRATPAQTGGFAGFGATTNPRRAQLESQLSALQRERNELRSAERTLQSSTANRASGGNTPAQDPLGLRQ